MKRLGISIYPEHASLQENKDYIELAEKYGVKRIFSCLLSVEKSAEEVKAEFKELIDFAHAHGMEIIFDVAPYVFDRLGISYDDLSFFAEIGADGIRLDEGFDGITEANMTRNPYGIKIEFNASSDTNYVDNILSFKPYKDKMITCHNFYPMRYTGLGWEFFTKCSQKFKDLDLPVAAFISCADPEAFGPWPNKDGLCNLPVSVAARHLFASGLVDDVIIANCFAGKEEFEELAKIDPSRLNFKLEEEYPLSKAEKEIIYGYKNHVVRGDLSDYLARSSQTRVIYKNESIAPQNTRDIVCGDVLIVNDLDGRYKGELQIARMDMPNDGTKNVAGHIPENERILMAFIEPWKAFKFIR
jgi:hypothetical protein